MSEILVQLDLHIGRVRGGAVRLRHSIVTEEILAAGNEVVPPRGSGRIVTFGGSQSPLLLGS